MLSFVFSNFSVLFEPISKSHLSADGCLHQTTPKVREMWYRHFVRHQNHREEEERSTKLISPNVYFLKEYYPKADDGQPRLDNEENSYDTRLRPVDIAVTKLEDDGSDEGKDIGGDDDGAAKEQVVGCTPPGR